VSGLLRYGLLVLPGLLLLPAPATAQVKFGEFSSNLNGTVSSGYSADYGNQTSSDHSWTAGGTADLSGSYYKPTFLSYNANFFLNQSRANSDFQSISNASGFGLSAGVFGGSRFPGAVSYSRGYNSDGNYGIPGLSSYVTHGDDQNFAVSWSLNLPKAPSLTAAYQMGDNSYSVYGSNDEGNSAYRTFNLRSTYKMDGFNAAAFYSIGNNHSLIPMAESAAGSQVRSNSDGYGLSVSHSLPLQGSVSTNFNRTTWDTNFLGLTSTGTVDTVNLFAAVHPTEKISATGTAQYSDNLAGQLLQSIVSTGSEVSTTSANTSSDSLDLQATVVYSPNARTQTSAFAERRTQLFEGTSYGVDSYGGGVTYTRPLLNGYFNTSMIAIGNISDNTGSDTLGFSTNTNYTSEFRGWRWTGSFGYAQNMQTLLVTYLNSSYHFSGSARRRWGKFNLSAGASGSRTGLTDQPDTASSSESYNASLGYGSILNTNASYSKASGQALATGAGLEPVPVPSPIIPSSLISLYGGDSYSFAMSSAPVRGLTLSTSYSRSNISTSSVGTTSTNENEQYNSLIQYQVRKTGFVSGYARLQQGFSGSGAPPEILSSFYVGLTRWFNFF